MLGDAGACCCSSTSAATACRRRLWRVRAQNHGASVGAWPNVGTTRLSLHPVPLAHLRPCIVVALAAMAESGTSKKPICRVWAMLLGKLDLLLLKFDCTRQAITQQSMCNKCRTGLIPYFTGTSNLLLYSRLIVAVSSSKGCCIMSSIHAYAGALAPSEALLHSRLCCGRLAGRP